MNTYHVVTTSGETRVEGTGFGWDEGMFSVFENTDARSEDVFMCSLEHLIYAKLIRRGDEPRITISGDVKGDSAIRVADQMRRAERDGTLYATN